MSVRVRKATANDLNFIVQELKEFSKDYGSQLLVFHSEEYTHEAMAAFIRDHLFLIAEKNETRMGFMAGAFYTHFFNPTVRVLHEVFWWVKPEHRGSRAAITLLNEFVRVGQSEANLIIAALGTDTKVNERALVRRGFKATETQYLLES